jgi:hypothetical protein
MTEYRLDLKERSKGNHNEGFARWYRIEYEYHYRALGVVWKPMIRAEKDFYYQNKCYISQH